MLILVPRVGREARDVGWDERRDVGCRAGIAQVPGRRSAFTSMAVATALTRSGRDAEMAATGL